MFGKSRVNWLSTFDIFHRAKGFPGGSVVKNPSANAEASGNWIWSLISGLGRSPGERNGNLLHYSCQDNPLDRGAWQATVHGSQRVGQSWVTEHKEVYGLKFMCNKIIWFAISCPLQNKFFYLHLQKVIDAGDLLFFLQNHMNSSSVYIRLMQN